MVENWTAVFGMLSLSETNCKGKAERCQNRLQPRVFCLGERLNQSGTRCIAVTMWLKQSVSHLSCEISHKIPTACVRRTEWDVSLARSAFDVAIPWVEKSLYLFFFYLYLFLSAFKVVNSELLVSLTAHAAVGSCPSETHCRTRGWRASRRQSLFVFFWSGFVCFSLVFELSHKLYGYVRQKNSWTRCFCQVTHINTTIVGVALWNFSFAVVGWLVVSA